MSTFSDYDKAEIARALQSEFDKNAGKGAPSTKVQRYSESTKTLYSDEETAKKKIQNHLPVFEGREKKELSIDEMLELLADENKEKEKPVRRGYAKIEEKQGKWHTD